MIRLFYFALAISLLVMTLHACDFIEPDTDKPFPEGMASVRVVNLAPLSTSISYFHKDQVVFNNIDFGDVTGYADVEVGYNVDGFLSAGGDTLRARREAFRDMPDDMRFFDFERTFTVYVLHSADSLAGYTYIRSMEIEPTPNAEGNARIRVLHAAPGVGAVDIYLASPGEEISEDNMFDEEIPFNNEGGSSAANNNSAPSEMPLYTTMPAGTYNVMLTLSGETDVVFEEEVTLNSSGNYTMVLYPKEDLTGVEKVLLLNDN